MCGSWCKLCFTYIDVGAMCIYIKQHWVNIPTVFSWEMMLFHCRQIFWNLRSIPLSLQQGIFNYRLSRVRRISDNTCGILVERFRIFEKPISVTVETLTWIIKATCALHNWFRKSTSRTYFSTGCVKIENGTMIPGEWWKYNLVWYQ